MGEKGNEVIRKQKGKLWKRAVVGVGVGLVGVVLVAAVVVK